MSNLYVTGETAAAGFTATSGSFQSNAPSPGSAFVSKITPDGSTLVYSTYLSGTGGSRAIQIRVDAQGEAVVAGRADSADFPLTPGAFDVILAQPVWGVSNITGSQRFIAKLSADGKREVFSTFFPEANAIDVDAAGNTYVVAIA